MNQDKVTYGFIAGEISPDFYGRSDLGKYDFGLKLARNFTVDYRGGLRSRGGFEFCAPVQNAELGVKLFPFSATEDDYGLLFGEYYMRPVRNGGYLLHTGIVIEDIAGDGVVTIPSHGLAAATLVWVDEVSGAVEFNKRYFEVHAVTTNTFRLKPVGGGTMDTSDFGAYISGGKVFPTVTTVTPYSGADIAGLAVEQRYEEIIVTSLDHAPAKITRVSDTSWAYAALSFGSGVAAPTGVTLTPSSAATAGVAFAVTAVQDTIESLPSPYTFNTLTVNYTLAAGSMRVNWTPVAGAQEYNIYRSLLLPIGAEISYAQSLGYVGRSRGPQFVDNNIIPDFTKAPPQHYNPFAPRGITAVAVSGTPTGYTNLSVVSATGGGSGFSAFPVVDPSGVLMSVVVTNPGSGYTSPTISVSVGTGATLTPTLGPSSGTYPALFKIFQQRGVYAATENEPMRLWASKPGDLENMDLSSIVNAGDGYSYQLDSREVRPIRHLVTLRSGLLIFSSKAITLLRAEEGKAVSGVNALAEPQAYKGANRATPLTIDLDVLFAQEGSTAINAMMYTEYTNTFQLQDVAVLANHLLGAGQEVSRMMWQDEPGKLVWVARSDGQLLSLTYDREQEVFAWSQHVTQGRVKDICLLSEGVEKPLYLLVERYVEGRWQTFLERLVSQNALEAEDHFGVDCGLRTQLTYPDEELRVSGDGESDVLFFNTVFATFGPLAVGDMIYFSGGKFEVTAKASTTEITVRILRDTFERVHVSGIYYRIPAGFWGWVRPSSEFGGMWHLEGETVSVNVDGDCFMGLEVSGGKVALPVPGAKVSVGLQYLCEAQTLPPVLSTPASEGKRKVITSMTLRLRRTRGLAVGSSPTRLVEMKDRQTEDWGQELALRSDVSEVQLTGCWDVEGTVYFRQSYPLPCSILSLVTHLDVGDE
jgi:hypothetical protein